MEHLSNSKLDVNWIESISGYEESLAKELYGSKAENSVIVINLAEDHGAKMIKLKDGRIVEFLAEIEKAESPLEIKTLN